MASNNITTNANTTEWKKNAIENFREYLKIPTVHPNVDYSKCVLFLQRQAKELDLKIKVTELYPKKPIIILSWVGTDPKLPSILLNGHMDVVPVFDEFWDHPPFGAHVDEKGNIYARGSQDMKCVNIQYLEAIRILKLEGKKFKRTIHVSFVPDEEIGGVEGMRSYVLTEDFKSLNVGFALDEGIASPTENYRIFYGERSIWHIWIHCPGDAGHGSLLIGNTAGEKVRAIINKFMDLREAEKKKMSDSKLKLGDVTTVNLTQISGGVQSNVIPSEIKVAFDIRLDSTKDHKEFEDMISGWCKEAGEGIYFTFEQKENKVANTDLTDSNIYWKTMKEVFKRMNINFETEIFQGGTDSRFVRALGIPAIGFSPMKNTKVLLHDHNEYLNQDVFIEGIEIYTHIISALGDL